VFPLSFEPSKREIRASPANTKTAEPQKSLRNQFSTADFLEPAGSSRDKT
jgi:hypothetical protein